MAEIITYSAASGMQAAMNEITNRTNNLGNVNSLGYKTIETETKDTFYNHITKAGMPQAGDAEPRPVGVDMGTGVKVTGAYRNLSQGAIKQTSNVLDMSIKGSGYFSIQLPDGRRALTRAGAFQVNRNRQIVTSDGYPLTNELEAIPENAQTQTINISSFGVVTVDQQEGDAIQKLELGRIQIVNVPNERGLEAMGGSLFLETEASGEAQELDPEDGLYQIGQHELELSNVDVSTEFASFLAAQQAYDMSARMLRAVDEMMKELNK